MEIRSNYIPKNLIKVKKTINISQKKFKGKSLDYSLRKELKLLNQLNPSELKNYNRITDYKKIKNILEYATNNIDKVSNKYNILYLVFNNLRPSLSKIIYLFFLNYYKNEEFYHFYSNKKVIVNDYFNENKISLFNRAQKNNNIEKRLVNEVKSGRDYDRVTEKYNLQKNTLLGDEFYNTYILNAHKDYLMNLSYNKMVEIIEKMTIVNAGVFSNNYFKKMEKNNYSDEFINKIIQFFGMPEEYSSSLFWSKFDGRILDYFIMLARRLKIQTALGDDRRSIFWKKYVENMTSLKINEHNKQIYMYFGNIVAVEFLETGNATYFYDLHIFKKHFEKYINKKTNIPNTILKDRQLARKKMNHAGRWESRFYNHIRKYF